jgi:hypothetical protein
MTVALGLLAFKIAGDKAGSALQGPPLRAI